MGNLASTIPFTELWERLLTMGRLDSPNNEDYAKGLVNDVYVRAIPRSEDWEPLIKEAYLSMTAKYDTGTVAISAAGTAITGTGTTWTTSMTAANGYKMKIAGNDNVYTFTYGSGTTGTLNPALSGATDLSGKTYVIFRDEYSLASDFSRFLKNGSVYIQSDGQTQDTIDESPRDEFRQDFRYSPADPIERLMLTRTHTSTGYRLVRVNPPPSTAKVYPYDYIQEITPMTDYNIGTVAVTSGSATVTGTGTAFTANVAVGDYFRVDSNGLGDSSKWYQVSVVDDNTTLTLSANFGEATESSLEYHCSKAPTTLPSPFHEYILYDALLLAIGEQGDPLMKNFINHRDLILSDLKKSYKSRRTNVQYKAEDDGYR